MLIDPPNLGGFFRGQCQLDFGPIRERKRNRSARETVITTSHLLESIMISSASLYQGFWESFYLILKYVSYHCATGSLLDARTGEKNKYISLLPVPQNHGK